MDPKGLSRRSPGLKSSLLDLDLHNEVSKPCCSQIVSTLTKALISTFKVFEEIQVWAGKQRRSFHPISENDLKVLKT